MNPTVIKVAKVTVKVASLVLPYAVSYFADKDLDAKISQKVAEALAKKEQ